MTRCGYCDFNTYTASELGGGVSPANAADQVAAAGVRAGVMVLLGSAAYETGSPEAAVAETVSSLRPNTALETA